MTISFCIFPLQLEQSLKGEEVVSKEIMAMSEEEIENEIKEVRLLCFLMSTLQKWVIVKKSSPKNLSANCRSTVGRQLTDRLPTVHRQLTNRLPTG